MSTTELRFDVEGMSCGGCAKSIVNALTKLDTVEEANASFENAEAIVQTSLPASQIIEAIEDLGFDATLK